jgi:RimJ/RimL family protein N-acetyltransferase
VTARKIVLPAEPLVAGPTALRPWRDSDLGAIVAACQDADIARWTSVPSPYGETDARAYLLARYDAIHAGVSAPFAIVAAHSAQTALLGSISLMRPSLGHQRAEVGYWLADWARGAGHATRAVQLICAWGFEVLELERIELLAATGNPASQRVAGRTGFTREAVLRSYMLQQGERRDMVAFSLLAHERAKLGAVVQ